MTLKAFRDGYLAARFLSAHRCKVCQLWGLGRLPSPCNQVLEAKRVCQRADALLDIDDTPKARIEAWLGRSPSRR